MSNSIAELSLRTTWHITQHVAHDKHSMCCTWFAHNCAWATWASCRRRFVAQWGDCKKNLELRLWIRLLLVVLIRNQVQLHQLSRWRVNTIAFNLKITHCLLLLLFALVYKNQNNVPVILKKKTNTQWIVWNHLNIIQIFINSSN